MYTEIGFVSYFKANHEKFFIVLQREHGNGAKETMMLLQVGYSNVYI